MIEEYFPKTELINQENKRNEMILLDKKDRKHCS